MKHSSELLVDADAKILADVMADLSTYPLWNDLVSNAVPVESLDDDPGPTWRTTLRAQVGPFARSKQLRFVRDRLNETDDHHRIRFIRRELDDRQHAPWTMEADVVPTDGASLVTLTLSYGGGLWIPALGTILGSAIERATLRLPAYLETR